MKRIRLLLWIVVVALVGVAASPTLVSAKGKSSSKVLVTKGQNLFDEQRYEESIQTLSAALLHPDATKAARQTTYKLLAFNYIVLGKKDEADGAVRGLLALDESYSLPDTESPRFREFFSSVRDKWVADGKPGLKGVDPSLLKKVKIVHAPPAQVDKGAGISLTGTIEDPEVIIDKVRLYYRIGTTGRFKSTRVSYAVRRFSVDIPGRAVKPPIIEYYLEASDENGLPVALKGDSETPLRIAVAQKASVLKSPWLWVPVGVAVVAAIVIPVAIVLNQDAPDSAVTINVFE
ncbi:MAG: hypothetical protein VB934_15965 [Polyangiaceae bacterium]